MSTGTDDLLDDLEGISGGDFLSAKEWEALADEGAEIVARVTSFRKNVPTDSGGVIETLPVFDCLILSGSRAGEYYPEQAPWKSGIITALKRKAVGKIAVGTMGWVDDKKRKGQKFVALQAPTGDLMDKVRAKIKAEGNIFDNAEKAIAAKAIEGDVTSAGDDEPPF